MQCCLRCHCKLHAMHFLQKGLQCMRKTYKLNLFCYNYHSGILITPGMPSGTSSSTDDTRSRIPKFNHKDHSKPRAERWRAFAKSLQSYMGTKASSYISYILRDDLDETEPNCNLPDELFTDVIDMQNAKKSEAAQDAFATPQWHLQQCLDENFGQTDEA